MTATARARGPPAARVLVLNPLPEESIMDRSRVVETIRTWEIHVECSPAETPAVAAALPKMIAAISGGSYQPDTIHIHQALQAAAEAQSLPHVRRHALSGRN